MGWKHAEKEISLNLSNPLESVVQKHKSSEMRYWIGDVKSSNKNVYFIVEINARRNFHVFSNFLLASVR